MLPKTFYFQKTTTMHSEIEVGMALIGLLDEYLFQRGASFQKVYDSTVES